MKIFRGCLWLVAGALLFYKGIFLIQGPFLVGLGIALGALKYRFVLSKTAKRMASQPFRLRDLLLIGVMMGLGYLLRFFPDPVRGVIDVAVGFALIRSSFMILTSPRDLQSSV
jgi:hypothetical protein